MLKLKYLLLSVLCLTTLTLSAQQKIAVVDMQKVFTGYDRTKTIEMQLNQQMDVYKQYATRLMNEYKAERKEFEKLRDESQNLSLDEAERKNREMRAVEKLESVRRKENELKEYNVSRQKQMKEQYDKLRSEVLQEIKQVVQNKAILEGWTMVLDSAALTLGDLPMVIYHSQQTDITKAVLDELNRNYRAGKKAAPAVGK